MIRRLLVTLAAAAAFGGSALAQNAPAAAPDAAASVATKPSAAKPKPVLSTRPPIRPEFREAAKRRAAERRRIDNCHKQATAAKITVRDRTKWVIACLDQLDKTEAAATKK